MYRARQIAHYIINMCTLQDEPISNLQLNKIMWLIQSAYCKAFNKLLFPEEFEAWQYGPVLPEIYDEYSFNGGVRIRKTYDEDFDEIDPFDKSLIDTAVRTLRTKYPWDLVSTTHKEGSPWHKVWNGSLGNHEIIPNEMLCESCS